MRREGFGDVSAEWLGAALLLTMMSIPCCNEGEVGQSYTTLRPHTSKDQLRRGCLGGLDNGPGMLGCVTVQTADREVGACCSERESYGW